MNSDRGTIVTQTGRHAAALFATAAFFALTGCGGPEVFGGDEDSRSAATAYPTPTATATPTPTPTPSPSACPTAAETDQAAAAYCATGPTTDATWDSADAEGCAPPMQPAEFEGLVAQIEEEEGQSLDSQQMFESMSAALQVGPASKITAGACRAACGVIFPKGGGRLAACLVVCKALKNTTCCGLRSLCGHYQRRGLAGLKFYEACLELYAVLCTGADVIDD